ncbi:MAG: hypothetical protein ABII00_11650 [Elusimicrobiota bacterium]
MNEYQKELILAYHDGELGEDEKREAEALLAKDPESRRFLESWREASGRYFKRPEVRASNDFVSRVMDRIDESAKAGERTSPWWWGWLIPALAAASLLLVLIPAPETLWGAREPDVSTDALLLTSGGLSDRPGWMASDTASGAETLLDTYLEEL